MATKTTKKNNKKNIPVNPNLKYDSLLTLVDRVDTLYKSDIAEKWIKGNKVITNEQTYHLLALCYYKKALVYKKLKASVGTHKIDNPHKVVIPGMKELKVG